MEKDKNKIQPEPATPEFREDLEELERYIEELSTFLPLPFCIVNPTGVILNINRAFCDLTGYNELEIVGETTDRIFGDKKEAAALHEEIFKKELVKNREINLVTKNKIYIMVNVSGSMRKDRDGNLIGYFLAFSDISELKRFQRQLEEKVEERTKQLKEKVEELERFNSLAVGRELKMIELKQEIEKLKNELEKIRSSQNNTII